MTKLLAQAILLSIVSSFSVYAELPPYCKVNPVHKENRLNTELSLKGEDIIAAAYKVVCDVSLEALIVNPHLYSGYYVSTDGFLGYDYHGDSLYPNCDNYLAGRWEVKINIINAKEIPMDSEIEKGELKYGFVYRASGIFDSNLIGFKDPLVSFVIPLNEDYEGCKTPTIKLITTRPEVDSQRILGLHSKLQ
jgi:hypothetical protein